MLTASLVTLCALGGVLAGVLLGQSRGLSPRLIAAGGGLLFGTSLFWIVPEIISDAGWRLAATLVPAGIALLWLIDHFVYHICPACSHDHDHHHCDEPPLHGFATPLLVASAIHSLLDGWSVQLFSAQSIIGMAAPLGLALHKIPEGLALGLIARKSVRSSSRALIACGCAEACTLLGAWIEPQADRLGTGQFGQAWSASILALIAGSFLFLGFHTVHEGRRKSGVLLSFCLSGVAVGAAALFHQATF